MNTVLFFVSSMLIIASGAIPSVLPIPAEALQGGALLSMTCTIWYLLARTFPAHLKAMKDQHDSSMKEMKDQRDAFLKHLKERE